MAKVTWMVLCNSTVVDPLHPNSLGAIGIINSINVALSKPLPKGQAVNSPIAIRLLTNWRRSHLKKAEKILVRYKWQRKGGLASNAIEAEIDLRDDVSSTQTTHIQGIPFDLSAEYHVLAQVKKVNAGKTRWQTVASLPIDVTISVKDDPQAPTD